MSDPVDPAVAPSSRARLETIYNAALDAVRGERVVSRAISEARSGEAHDVRPIEVLAAGKASLAMLRPALRHYGDRVVRALAVVKEPAGERPTGCEVVVGGHPMPDQRSLEAGRLWLERAASCPPDHRLLVLLSGGASALLSRPAPGLRQSDLRGVTELLLRSGADIEALNTVRKHLGSVGGGRSLQATRCERIEVLAISDVAGDRLDLIGSGPFFADPNSFRDAMEVLDHFGLNSKVSGRVLRVLGEGARGERPETLKPGDVALERVQHRIVASLDDALEAAADSARSLGFQVSLWPLRLATEAREEAAKLARAAMDAPRGSCLIAAGEPVVTVRGAGRGGRCQELALALALELQGVPGFVALAAGTDGSDGPTDAAGAWVDGGSVARGHARGVDAREALEANDSHRFFGAEGGLLRTGPTGTNVNDLVLVATT